MVDNKYNAITVSKKPWGLEYLISENEFFVCKIIHIFKDEAVSLQYHEEKLETLYVIQGKGIYYLQKPGEEMTETIINTGDILINNPYEVHRERAIEDLVIFEVSTPNMDDIIRVEDDYGRAKNKA